MLDPRAPEHEIAAAARWGAFRSKNAVRSVTGLVPAAVLAERLDLIALEGQARPVAKTITLAGRIGRMVEACWWQRNMRRTLLRVNEAREHAQGTIRRRGECYVSNHAIKRLAARAKSNREVLAGLEVVNTEGDAFNLLDVADASLSNPKLRRTELMVRCAGFEDVAAVYGHEAVFLTITCPSRFHRFSGNGEPNAKWDGSTPREAQDYLCKVWARIRAEWKREGFAPYGFRVAEPHHDGCPHWHVLLFAPADQMGWFVPRRYVADREDAGAGLVGVAGRHALADSAGEAGALKHRFTCERIDPSKGSATGYIAKYIAKNIDGEKADGADVGLDFASGTNARDGARRVRAWASVWGIRQFQQIGGPSVTVWRELRRLANLAAEDDAERQLELFARSTAFADMGRWANFWMELGGPDVAPRSMPVRPYYEERADRYGDEAKRVRGLTARVMPGDVALGLVKRNGLGMVPLSVTVHTRRTEWTVQTAGQHLADAGIRVERGEAAPWTGVNNCTEPGPDEAVRLDFLRGQGGQERQLHHGPPTGTAPSHRGSAETVG